MGFKPFGRFQLSTQVVRPCPSLSCVGVSSMRSTVSVRGCGLGVGLGSAMSGRASSDHHVSDHPVHAQAQYTRPH
eukprot:6718878-Alexandrium_andersonii.AAC.1